jgi:phosphoribosylformylglycinamidine synthase PurS subunit
VKARVYVTLRKAVLDPQGEAVRRGLGSLGYDEVSSVRIGKFLELELDGARDAAEKRLREMCQKLLANTVIEDFRFEID